MLTLRVGPLSLSRRHDLRGRILLALLVLVPSALVLGLILQRASSEYQVSSHELLMASLQRSSKQSAGLCIMEKKCPEHSFGFYIQSGAGPSVDPKICIQNKLVLGSVLKNTGHGVNLVVLDSRTGNVTEVGHFTHKEDLEPLTKVLQSLERGLVVLIASYESLANRINDEIKQLISGMGSSFIMALQTRDNWVFVGGKGATAEHTFEKREKHDSKVNVYGDYPELTELEGCIPKFHE